MKSNDWVYIFELDLDVSASVFQTTTTSAASIILLYLHMFTSGSASLVNFKATFQSCKAVWGSASSHSTLVIYEVISGGIEIIRSEGVVH